MAFFMSSSVLTREVINMISCKNVTKNYGKHKVLDNLNLEIPKGKIVGLFGPNGAGKTMMLYKQ